MKKTILATAIALVVSSPAWANGDHRQPPKVPVPSPPHEHPFPDHDHPAPEFPEIPDFSQQIEELYNKDRLQQALIEDQFTVNTEQFDLIRSNKSSITNTLDQLSDLSGRFNSLNSKVTSLEGSISSFRSQYSRAIAAAGALDFEAPNFHGTKVSINVGSYDGYESFGLGFATKMNGAGEPTFGFGFASSGGETVYKGSFSLSLEMP